MARNPSPKTAKAPRAPKAPKVPKADKAIEALPSSDLCPITEDLHCQQVTWIVERVGWALMGLVVIAALAGLFGGPTTREDVRDESGRLLVSYQHFQRHLDPTDVRLTVDTRGQSLFEITIDQDLAKLLDIRTIMPTPLEIQAHDGGLLMKFAASPESEQPAQIAITGVPTRSGKVSGRIGLLGESATAQLDIFIYP